MRLAFVDLLFSWPPNGGADVDLYHVLNGLHRAGHEVHLIVTNDRTSWERGTCTPEALPFPATRLDFDRRSFNRRTVPQRVRAAVDQVRPEAVVVADGFFLKPYVIRALAGYPTAGRYYAYELACHKDILRYKHGGPCPKHYLRTPEDCRQCALHHLAPAIKGGHESAWLQEYRAARAYAPGYYPLAAQALRQLAAGIVSNTIMQEDLAPWCKEAFVVPGGVDLARFHYTPAPPKSPRERKVILMAGRGEDPVKGLGILMAAGRHLRRTRHDFEMWVTMPEDESVDPWVKPLGQRSLDEMTALYKEADVCAVPSVWDEPFGLVAAEAMAAGRPVCASRVGGLQDIVVHTETGFLFERDDAEELAKQLSLLLDNAEMRARMGQAGRQRVEEEYAWHRVIEKHYPPVLEHLARKARANVA